MEVILSELREGGIDMDMGALAYYIGLRERHGALYSEMCVRVQPSEMGRLIFDINVLLFRTGSQEVDMSYIFGVRG